LQVKTPYDFGRLIRDARRRKSMTQGDLCRRLGVAQSWLSEVENGKMTAEIGKVLQTMALLGITLDASLGHANVVTPVRGNVIDAEQDDYPDIDDIVGGPRR
jgi:y4mF family transcriptional regulator